MATIADLDRLALALPQVTKELSEAGRPSYRVGGKMFCFHRGPRRDAVDAATGELMDDVLMFRVADLEEKELLLQTRPEILFTTPHFKGYPAVLMRISSLGALADDALADLLVEAWLTRAPRRVAKAWLAEQGQERD